MTIDTNKTARCETKCSSRPLSLPRATEDIIEKLTKRNSLKWENRYINANIHLKFVGDRKDKQI